MSRSDLTRDWFKYISTCVLNTASTILGLVRVLAILLSAVLGLGLYMTVKILGLIKYFLYLC